MSALSKDSLSESLTYIAVQMRLGRAGTLNSGTAGFILEVRDLLAAKDAEIARLRTSRARLVAALTSLQAAHSDEDAELWCRAHHREAKDAIAAAKEVAIK